MSRIPLPSSPRGRRRPGARPGHSASRHDFRAPCRGLRGERGEGSERLNCEPVAEPLLERIRRAERACKQLNTSGLSEPTCFLCEADKWKYERPEVKVRETKVKRERKMAKEGDQDGLYSLMLALSKLCKHQNGDRSGDLWTWLLEPLRSLVPCEEVKFVVRCLGPALPTPTLPFSHDAEARRRVTAITYVEKWPQQRIEGHAAMTQRIQVIPSPEAARQDWIRFEVVQSHCASPNAGRACRVKAGSDMRCLAAVPLLDAGGNILAVAKFLNRRTRSPDGQWQPCYEFSQADLKTLAAFAAVFECVAPYPFLSLLGAPLQRPQARIGMNDFGIVATLQWQVPSELGGGPLCHEVWYGPVEDDDDFEGCASKQSQARELWQHVPCGYMEPISEDEDLDELANLTFEFNVPIPHEGFAYAFRVRCRSQHTSLDWSEPSLQVSAHVVPPYPSQEAIQVLPISETAVQLEWHPFYTSEGMSLVEYRVIAQANEAAEAEEQVVACFISDGRESMETVTVTYLQSNVSYIFAVEARYPHIGMREFSRGLTSDTFSFHTADITLPAPQVLALDSAPVEVSGGSQGAPLLLRWPYPQELSSQLVLQYRMAMAAQPGRGRYQVLMWNCIHPSACVQAQLRSADDEPVQLRVLRLNLQDCVAAQLRVLMPRGSGSIASPPSAWFCPQPPPRPQGMHVRLAVERGGGVRLLASWEQFRTVPRSGEELGAVASAVQHDFDRGNGPSATRFQARIRMEGEVWEEMQPQLLPRPRKDLLRREVESYEWSWHDSRLAAPGQLEVQLRHGNAILWSSWSETSNLRVGVEAPRPVGALLLEEVTPYCVSLCWPPFAAALQLPLEYRVQCRESDNCDRDVEWHTVGIVEAAGNSDAFLRHKLKFLRPEKSYQFAIECRYQSLPVSGRLETTQLGPREFPGF